MPREITHRFIAQQTVAAVADTSLAAWAVRRPACLSLGAVFPDALFYAAGEDLRRYRWVAEQLHGEDGGDTFLSVRGLADALRDGAWPCDCARPDRASLAAFLVGHVSHIAADATFHPFVYYHSGVPGADGSGASAATQGHRRLEALIDWWLLGGMRRIVARSLADDLATAGGSVKELARAALAPLAAGAPSGQTATPDELARAAGRALGRFARAERLFRRRLPSGLLAAAWPLLPAGVREIAALGYAPQLRRRLHLLDGSIAYRHPVTGAPAAATIDGLVSEAVTRAAAVCRRVAQVVEGDPAAAAWLAAERGPGLSSGLPGVPESALRFAAARPLVPV